MTLLYPSESYGIRGSCFWVWKEFGSAFKESIIENALVEELQRRGFKVDRQKRIDIYYNEKKMGTYIPDLIINDVIIVELKSKQFLISEDVKRFWHYLKATNYKLGFLINFGERLWIKRVVYDSVRPLKKNGSALDLRSGSARDQRL